MVWVCHRDLAQRRADAHLLKTCTRQTMVGHTKSLATTTVPLPMQAIEDSSNDRHLTMTSTTITTGEEVVTMARLNIGVLDSLEWQDLTRAPNSGQPSTWINKSSRHLHRASHSEEPPGYRRLAAPSLSRT